MGTWAGLINRVKSTFINENSAQNSFGQQKSILYSDYFHKIGGVKMGIFDGKTFEGIVKTALSDKKIDKMSKKSISEKNMKENQLNENTLKNSCIKERNMKENDENPKNFWASQNQFWASEEKNSLEHFLQSYLTSNAAIREQYNIELNLWRAFHSGVRIREIDGYFWLCYTRDNDRYMKIFSRPKYKEFITYHLGRIKPKDTHIEYLKEEEIENSVAKYRELFDSEEMIAKYYDSRIIIKDPYEKDFPDDSEIWLELFHKAAEYNEELFTILHYIRACKARLVLKGGKSYVIDREYFTDKNEEIYTKHIQPFLMQHLEWLKTTLKSLNK